MSQPEGMSAEDQLESEVPPRARLWAALAVALALVELILAGLAWVLAVSKNEGFCPGGSSFSCAGLFRERLGSLGPLHLSQLAPLGAILTLIALIAVRFSPREARGLRRGLSSLVALGAGIALAAQVLAFSASGALCLVCAGVALAAFLALCALGAASPRRDRSRLLLVFALSLGLASGVALGRGLWLRGDDSARRARLEALAGSEGPRLLLVTRSGCSFCATFELDRLGDPSLEDLLNRTRGLERIPESDPRALRHAGGHGAPVLIAVDSAGESLGRVRGVKPLSEVRAFLESVVARASAPPR